MNPLFSHEGGARLGYFNASWPFALLSGDSEELILSCLGRDYTFSKSKIRRLSRYRGLFSVGLRIEHSVESAPDVVIFWASLLFWTKGFERLKVQLEGLGYHVQV